MKWILGVVAGACALLLIAFAIEKAVWDGPYQEIRDALWQVELGHSMNEVAAAVPFKPIRTVERANTRSGRRQVTWYYDHHPVAAVIPSVVFDKESSRVVAVYVNDVRQRLSPSYLGKAK